MNIEIKIKQVVSLALKELYRSEVEESSISIQKTKKEFKGHLTLVVFPFLKISKRNPGQTAEEIGAYMLANSDLFSEYNVVGGFLNLCVSSSVWINAINDIESTPNYGILEVAEHAPLFMVEYSSPNTNKPLHLGHIRNNLLGYSICNILRANGKNVVMTNIVNDRGIHICKSMLAWKKWGEGETPESSGMKGDHLVGKYYVLFDKNYKKELTELQEGGLSKEKSESQSKLMQEAREMLLLWETGDTATVDLWKMMNEWVYAGFDETYKEMGVSFDKIYYESDTYLVGRDTVLKGLEKGLFVKKEDGSVWADLTDEGLDEKILLRGDGTSVYMTQDIGTAKLRFDDYKIDKMIYVVGNEQNYHFQVLSIILDKLGFEFGKDLVHFSYGMVELPEGKMKSREGTVVDADDLMAEMVDTAKETSRELGKLDGCSEVEADTISKIIGLGALKYFILKVDPRKNMTFNPKESIDFNGNTGPFIQYTFARIQSILRKAKEQEIDIPTSVSDDISISYKEESLIQLLVEFRSVVSQSGNEYNPATIANYVYDLVKEYNQFYHDFSILKEEDVRVRAFRIMLSKNVGEIIKRGMSLLGIDMPDRM